MATRRPYIHPNFNKARGQFDPFHPSHAHERTCRLCTLSELQTDTKEVPRTWEILGGTQNCNS